MPFQNSTQKEASATCVSFGFASHVVKRTPSFGLAVSVHMLLLSITTLNTAEPCPVAESCLLAARPFRESRSS